MSRANDLFRDLIIEERMLETKIGQRLLAIEEGVEDWEAFREPLEAVWRPKQRKSNAGRRPIDALVMFRILLMQRLMDMSDEAMADHLKMNRLFVRFAGIDMSDTPDEKTIWKYRDALSGTDAVEAIFASFLEHLTLEGYGIEGGQLVDASFVEAPIRRKSAPPSEPPDEDGDRPGDAAPDAAAAHVRKRRRRAQNSARQVDRDANWAKKNGRSIHGYKQHLMVDGKHKIIRMQSLTPASVHDSNELDELTLDFVADRAVYADKAYRSKDQEARLKARGMTSRIAYRATSHKPLSQFKSNLNRRYSGTRVRVEHVFAQLKGSIGGRCVRSIGLARAQVWMMLGHFLYNLQRFALLKAQAAAV